MSYEMFCEHCIGEPTVADDWPHWSCCPACAEAGHTTGREACPICDKQFHDNMKAISDGVDARVLREGLICVKESTAMNLRLGGHYKVVSLDRSGCDHWTTVIDDSGEAHAYPAELFRSVRDDRNRLKT